MRSLDVDWGSKECSTGGLERRGIHLGVENTIPQYLLKCHPGFPFVKKRGGSVFKWRPY